MPLTYGTTYGTSSLIPPNYMRKNMETINASFARSNLFTLLTTLSKGDEPKLIHSRNGDCVLVSKQEWDSIQETIFLLSNKAI